MAITMKQLVRRHGAAVAAVTAACVAVTILVLQVLQYLVQWISILPYNSVPGDFFSFAMRDALLTAIPFGVGFFLSLWIIAPIAEELRIGHVITRSILATGVGATIVFIVKAVLALLGAVRFTGPLFGNSFPPPGFDAGYALAQLGGALQGALVAFLSLVALGVLAGVLLWLWRKDHPPKHPLAGIIDV